MSEETQKDQQPQEPPAATAEPRLPDESASAEASAPTDDDSNAEAPAEQQPSPLPAPEDRRALLEAIIFVAEEPLPLKQIVSGLGWPRETVQHDIAALVESYTGSTHGIEIRNVAGGYRMYTKAERHEEVKAFVKTLRPKLKLSMPALETLAVIAYKQPVTVPEIQAIRGVNAAGVINTLLQRKLIAPAGRKKVIGKPMMYKTTKEFLVQFGLSGVDELPSLKELEELSKAAFGESEEPTIDPVDPTDGGDDEFSEPVAVADQQDGQLAENAEGMTDPAGDSEETDESNSAEHSDESSENPR